MWKDRVEDWRDRGITPGDLHRSHRSDLPCMDHGTCPYLRAWENIRDKSVVIGHPTHTYIPEVVNDRIVIFDEDIGEAFRQEFDSNALHRIVSEYLSEDRLPWPDDAVDARPTSREKLVGFRDYGNTDTLKRVLSELRAEDLYNETGFVGRTHGHASARAVILY